MNSYTIKILVFLLSVFILITISSQIYLASQDNYKTETAMSYSAVEKIDFKGIYVRNEKVINSDVTGVLNYPNPDGSKIAKNSVVAYVYNSEADIATKDKITALTEELNLLKKAESQGTSSVAQPEFLSKLIEEKYQGISSSIQNNDLSNLDNQRNELLNLMNIMQIVIKKEQNYSDRIAYLESEISTLTAQKTEPVKTISVENPGYFVSYVDGYEDKISTSNVGDLTVQQIKNIISNPDLQVKNTNSIGKVIEGYQWKMIGIIDNSKNKFFNGSKVLLNIPSSTQPISATIDDIKDTSNPKESIVIVSCDNLTYNLVQHRVERVEMCLNNFEGIKVPRKAIRFSNGEKGVYIKLGQELIFKKIDVIFEGEDYVISNKNSKNGYLALYDDIIVEGISANQEVSTNVLETATVSETTTAGTTGESQASNTGTATTSVSNKGER